MAPLRQQSGSENILRVRRVRRVHQHSCLEQDRSRVDKGNALPFVKGMPIGGNILVADRGEHIRDRSCAWVRLSNGSKRDCSLLVYRRGHPGLYFLFRNINAMPGLEVNAGLGVSDLSTQWFLVTWQLQQQSQVHWHGFFCRSSARY